MGIFDFFRKPIYINIDGAIIIIHNKKEALFYISGMYKIAKDCANLVNTTKNPDVFFMRYNLLIDKLENMSKLESFNCFKDVQPSQNLATILNKKELTINDFIDRFYDDTLFQINNLKTDKAKEKRIENFYQKLLKYNDEMLPKNIEKYTLMYENLLSKTIR